MVNLILYSWWRSSCSWRVRTALYLKGLDFELQTVDFVHNKKQGDNMPPEIRQINPLAQIPILVMKDDGKADVILTQSLAIIQWLEEAFPETNGPNCPKGLLPSDPILRYQAQMISQCIAFGIQPIQNVPIPYLWEMDKEGKENDFDYPKKVITERFGQLEIILPQTSGKYCVGDEITVADVCLLPQVFNAAFYGVDMQQFPIISRIAGNLESIPAFIKGHPHNQPDYPGKTC